MTLSHLDDDALSAALDGESTPQEQSHLAACTACQGRITAFRAVSQVVGASVLPRPQADVVAALQKAIDAGSGAGEDDAMSRLRRPSAGRRVMLMAAAIVIVLGAVGGLLGLLSKGSGGKSASTSLGASRQSAPASASPQINGQNKGLNPSAAPSRAAGPAQASGSSVQRGPDLGAQSDPAVVARLVDGRLNVGGEAAPAAGSSTNSGNSPVPVPCAEQGSTAVGLSGQQASLVYTATVRWRGEDSVALVYLRPNGRRVGVIMRLSDCSQLAVIPV